MFLFWPIDQKLYSQLLQCLCNLQEGKHYSFHILLHFQQEVKVKAQAACTLYLICMTVRIIAVSNPLGLQCVPVHDNSQGDRQDSEMKLGDKFKYLTKH